MDYKDLLYEYPTLIIKENEALSKYTYTKTGGVADLVFFPRTINEIQSIINWTTKNNLSLTIIGLGSNIIIRDGGLRGATLILTNFNSIEVTGSKLIAQAGASIIEASKAAHQSKLTGLEFACGIPGSIGGAVYMNAGAYGGEVKDVIETMTILKKNGEIKIINNEEMNFSYRYSNLMETDDVLLDVTFGLKRGFILKSKFKIHKLTRLRKAKQPLEYPSCGSVFKDNPDGLPSPTSLIAQEGLQGEVRGGAQISKKHPNFIVNINNATSSDYIELIEYIQLVILQKHNIKLEPEPRIIGDK